MFIENSVKTLFSLVEAVCYDIGYLSRYVAPTELKSCINTACYKHIAPLGLNTGQSQSSWVLRKVHKNVYVFLN